MSESFISEVVRSNQLRMDDDYSYSIDNGKMIISQPQTMMSMVGQKIGQGVEAGIEGAKGVIKGVPTGLGNFAEQFNKTFLPGYEETVVPFLNENVPGLKSLNSFLQDTFEYKNKAQEVGGSFIGEPIGEFGVTGGALSSVAKGAGVTNRFLSNVLGYGSAEVIAVPVDEQGLLSMGIDYLAPDSQVTTAILESLKSDEDQSVFIQKLQKAPENFFVGGVVGEQLDKAIQGVGTLYKYIKNSPKLDSIKQELKGGISNLGDKAREFLDKNRGGTTLGSTDIPKMVAEGTVALDEMVNPKQKMQKGIPFQKEKTDNNLRLHKMRLDKLETDGTPYPGGPKNERTVIKAPNDNLPDFVVGKITFDDWIARTEKLLTPEEIMAEKDWYDDVFKEFDKVAGDEPDMLRKLGEAWLSAQQNETPSTALTNVLSIFEQFKRGVPFEDVKGKGLPEANKIASSIIYGKEITGGAGQKISDFIDSGYSKPVRSIMGDDPGGGMPFVVDIHTARDTGLVDRKLVNHLTRLGYKVPKNVVLDVGEGGIKGPMYENRAIFGRELTDHLNSIKWQGKDDWRPQEVQAVGWMALSNKLTGEGGRGGNTATAMARNTSRIAMEVDPGAGSPWADKYGADYGSLDEVDRIAINNTVTQKAIEMVAKSEGAVLNTVVHGQGGWKQYTNPSSVMEGLVTFDTAKRVASRLGYLLNQTEVLVSQSKPLTANPENFGLMIVAKGGELSDKNNLDNLMERMLSDDKLGLVTQGYHPITLQDGRAGINIVITKQTLIDAKKEGVIKSQKAGKEYIMDFVNNELSKITDDLNFDAEADILESVAEFVGNDWTKDKTGGNYKINFGGKAGTDAKDPGGSDIDIDGQELEALFSSEITKAKAKKGSREVTSSVGGDDG
ncbi:hypothetical protein [Phenylobacterium sp.]|uniref:hypothetical protein n=1 Tax=Phenylobacterium sp. TaxID=1871053 RepID=UPI0025F7D302|nr:hypothetical protein [Phenylobacterium sp.]